MNLRMVKPVCLACTLHVLSLPVSAVVSISNGSFESTGTQYSPVLGGLRAASSWTNLSGLNIQACSMVEGGEGTPFTANGSRILRLVNDKGDVTPANIGRIAQNLGTMVAGETYTFNADAFGGTGLGLAWGATAKFVNAGTANPSIAYAAQTVDGVGAGAYVPNAFSFSYTAQPADAGLPLWIWLESKSAGAGQTTRGGIDNARLTVTTAPSSAKDILTFNFGALGPASIWGTNIFKSVVAGTVVTNLAPTFTLSPFATATPVSGTASNFSSPQTYFVTAQDGSTKSYLVTVSVLSGNLTVQDNGTSLRVDNGLVRLDLVRTNSGFNKTFAALDAAAQWQPVCSAFVPDFAANPGGNALFDATATARRYRVHEMATNQYSVTSLTATSVVVQVTGSYQGAALTESMTLRTGDNYFHVTVAAALPTNSLDYCMSSYVFNHDGPPEFVHSPTAKKEESRWSPPTPASGQVIGDVAFHAPALVLQDGGLFAAIVPDLDSINRDEVLSPDARRTQYVGATVYDTPVEADKYSMPTALDLNLTSGLSTKPVLSYGMMDFIVSHHMHYYRVNDATMIRTLGTNAITYGFDLFVGAQEPANRGFQQVSRHLWQKYGQPLFRSRPHLALPFEEYVKLVYGVVSQPMSPSIQTPVPGYEDHGVFLDFTMSNQPVGSMVAPLGVLGFGDALWNFEFWNPVRDASGMYYWGQKLGKPDLVNRARRIINLALLAPQNSNGLFCLTYLAQSQTWLRGTVSTSARSLFSKNNDTYDVPAMSKTAAHLLEFYQQCEPDARIIAYLTPYANWLAANVDAQGRIPSYYTPAMTPSDPFAVNAQSAASLWFLAEMYSVTNNPAYLAGALKIADYLTQNVVPRQLWMDLEPYFSDGQNPLTFTNDAVQGLPIRGNLSTLWAAQGFAALYRVTGSNQFLVTGEQVLDYLAFSQNCWNFHYIYTAFPFGGVTSDNVDTAADLDARQAETVGAFFWYGQTLGRQDLLERAVAAARSGAVLINHPLHIANDTYAHPNIYGTGLGPENINHEGHNQSAMRTHPSWGECSAIFTGLGTADYRMNGCYVNVTNGLCVGVNGLWCTNVSLAGTTLSISVSSQLAAQSSPWTSPFRTAIKLLGLQTNVNYTIRINDLAPVSSTNYSNGIVPIQVLTNGTVSLAVPEIVLSPDSLVIPESGTGTCSVALSDPVSASGVTVTVSRTSGDPTIVLQGASSYSFGTNNWNVPQTLTFTSPRGANWQNRTSIFQLQSPGYANRTLTVTDQFVPPASARLTNGSFEITDTLYSSALGGIYHPVGWTNLSGLDIQASSVPAGCEGTSASGATGNRILRLVSDMTNPANVGRIAQDLGAMTVGETYSFTADALGGDGVGSDALWGATAAFVNQVAVTPSVIYASQVVSNVGAGQVIAGAFNLTYTAQPGDQGNHIVLWLQARAVANDSSATRGGLDNARLTVTPPPVTITVLANPTSAGSVSGGGVYPVGANVQLTATASNHWSFSAWNDADTNALRNILAPATNATYTANFSPTPPKPAIMSFIGPVSGNFTLGGTTDIPGTVVTQRTTNFAVPIIWDNLQTNPVPGGAFSFPVPQGTSAAGYFRLRGQ